MARSLARQGMNSDRWKQLDNLLQSLLERPPRSAIRSCGGLVRAMTLWNASCAPS